MGISIDEIVTGRKTFFICPDTSILPESFLEDYFSLGYECYFIENDKKLKLEKKLEILISLFHDVIFFFNIDYNIPDISWPVLIRQIIDQHRNRASIGVVYTKRQTQDEKNRIEYKYLYELGLNCGCIQLEYQKKINFNIIERILYANQAQGRRKNIRALCTKACTFAFTIDGNECNGILQDISLSHFSFVYPKGIMNIQLYEKLSDIHFNIRGFMFRSDAVLIMQRQNTAGDLFIFSFVSSTGANGLDNRIKALLIPNVYQLMANNFKVLIERVYEKVSEETTGITALEDIDNDII